jgi:hypothetical protein
LEISEKIGEIWRISEKIGDFGGLLEKGKDMVNKKNMLN